MRDRINLIGAFVGLGCLFMATSQSAAETLVLRYSNWLPPTYFMHAKGIYKFFAEVEKVTQGRVKIEPSAGALGPPPRNYQLAVDGIADVTWGLHGYTPGTFPLSEMAELPFQSYNAAIDSVAYWRVYKKFFAPANMHKGVHTLTVHVHPAGQIYNSKRPIKSIVDFKGLKIRATNSAVATNLKLLGATPVGMPVTKMRDALSKGIVDGISLTDEALYNFKVSKFIKHALNIPGGLYNSSFFLVMNKNKWDKIAPADQKAIMSVAGETLARKLGEVWQAEQDSAVPKIKNDGIKTVVAVGAFLAEIKKRIGDPAQEWVKKAKKLGVDGNTALALFRETQKSAAK